MDVIKNEDILQVQVVEFIKQCTNIPVVVTANQRKCTPWYGKLLKRMGVKKGVSDLFFPRSDPRKEFKGMWIELKTLNGKPSCEQINFLVEMRNEGYYATFCYGSDEAIKTIKQFYDLKI